MSNSTAMGGVGNWQGYLLASGGNRFPHNYIKVESYDVSPDIREEIKAYRDDYSRNLFRITAEGMKSKIEFDTLDELSLAEMYAIQNFFYSSEIDHKQRKIAITYWNPEYFRYDTGYFYRPDVQFKIKDISYGTITYKGIRIALIEY